MRTFKSLSSTHKHIARLKHNKKSIGFVPTMGALHNGHRSLIRRSRRENDITVVSVFVNPLQFDDKNDLRAYPRPAKKDELFAKKEKVDIIFYPSMRAIYPEGFLTSVKVERLSEILEGRQRPGHFGGVTTVVAKLLNIVNPDRLYLGQKDAQQAIIISRLVADLNYPVTVKVCPTVREKDGLAISSRNERLKPSERKEAPVIFHALREAQKMARSGTTSVRRIRWRIRETITRRSSAKIDYIECLDARSLKQRSTLKGHVMIAIAVRFSGTRLIDNITFRVP